MNDDKKYYFESMENFLTLLEKGGLDHAQLKEGLDHRLIETLKNFESLDEESKKKVISTIQHDWNRLRDDFSKIISMHPELAENINSLRLIKSQNGPTAGDYFKKCYGIDPITDEPDYVYDEKLHNESQYLYENWKKVESDFKKKLSRLQTSTLIPNRKKRIESLKKEFETCSEKAQNYKKFYDDTNSYNFYMKNPQEIPYLRYAIRAQIETLSKDFLGSMLEINPKLICYQSNVSAEDWERYPQFMCAQIKEDLIKLMEPINPSPTQPGVNE